MKILFLDDDRNRHAYFQRETIGQDVRHVETAAAAIAALEKHGPFDVACLDHDLGGEQMAPLGTAGHGLEVARWLAAHPHTAENVVIHSYNPVGAQAMADVLVMVKPVNRVPFGPGLVGFLRGLARLEYGERWAAPGE